MVQSTRDDRPTVLLVDHDPEFVERVSRSLRAEFEFHPMVDGHAALRELKSRSFDAVLLDVAPARRPSGFEILRRIRQEDADIPTFMLSSRMEPDLAVRAGREGATGYSSKEGDLQELAERMHHSLSARIIRRAGQPGVSGPNDPSDFIGASEVVQQLVNDAATVAGVDSTVLITGENGTGKEVLARLIHRHSARSRYRFVAINCAAIPGGLVESELFGHERDSFTGATSTRRGSYELADRGTLLLDEITEMPLPLQPKLLRALQSGEFSRVGSEEVQRSDARVICSSNRELSEAVKEGHLRQDLYYRINVVSLHIPPLRERREDIPVLARYFLKAKAKALGKAVTGFTPEAEAILLAHDWPGNARELENLVERAVVFSRSRLIRPELLSPISEGAAYLSLPWEEARKLALRRFERGYLTALLRVHNGSVSQAAKAMGVSRQAFYKALDRSGLRIEEFRTI